MTLEPSSVDFGLIWGYIYRPVYVALDSKV